MRNNLNRNLKRCPKCKSSKIYRRVRAKVWSTKAKDYKGDTVEKFEKLSRTYFCQKCGHEFDVPFVLSENIQNDINNDENKDIK